MAICQTVDAKGGAARLVLILALGAITTTAGASTEFSRELSAKLGLAQTEQPTETKARRFRSGDVWILLGVGAATYGVVLIAKAAADDSEQCREKGIDVCREDSGDAEKMPIGIGAVAAGLLLMVAGLEDR